MKYYIIAGERSGDLHAANLIRHLKLEDLHADIRAVGGEMMQQQGAAIFKKYHDISFMGFLEVFLNATTLLRIMKEVKADILLFRPDVLILVDFAGFNLRVAKFAKQNGLKVFYYISPKVWAWNQGRAKKIKKVVDKMFVILPFETAFYHKFHFTVDYVGNPVNDAITQFLAEKKTNVQSKPERPVIALLPGSRVQEVSQMLEILDGLPALFPTYDFVIAAVSNLPDKLYQNYLVKNRVRIVYDQSYELLHHSTAAVVTSGTATLETALFNVPQVVVYKTSQVTYFIAKSLITVKYISLVNLIADKEAVKELIQNDFTLKNVQRYLSEILESKQKREEIFNEYIKIKEILGENTASQTTAKLMTHYLRESR